MIKHFEQLWEESEMVESSKPIENLIAEITGDLIMVQIRTMKKESCSDLIGKILYNFSKISKNLDINVYESLSNYLEDLKKDSYDPEEPAK